MTEANILIVEDNEDLAFGLRAALENENYAVTIAGDGTTGLALAKAGKADLVVLDLMLPGMDGYRLLRALRDAGVSTPVLVLTAKGEEANKVQAFSIGADDYVTKPFGVLELIARVKALLRRAGGASGTKKQRLPGVERFGDIEVNPASRTVYQAGRLVSLAPREYDLLMALLERNGAVASRADLLREIWGYQNDVASRTVDIHVAELRRKLEPGADPPRHIITVRKVGYRLER
jgi:DNA-binding response OmpR family regulator